MKFFKKLFTYSTAILLLSCSSNVFEDKIPYLLGLKYVQSNHIFGSDQFGGFGEGYTFESYKLSMTTIQQFENLQNKKLPLKSKGNEWNQYNWSNKLIDSTYNEIFSMAFNYLTAGAEIKNKIIEIKKYLGSPTIYYAFYYKPGIENISSIELFILDIKSQELNIIASDM